MCDGDCDCDCGEDALKCACCFWCCTDLCSDICGPSSPQKRGESQVRMSAVPMNTFMMRVDEEEVPSVVLLRP